MRVTIARLARARLCTIVLGCLAVGLSAVPAAAAVIHVPVDQPTIQAAIDLATNGDTVLVAPGTYAEILDFRGKAITVASEQGAELTIIDGNRLGSVVTFASGEGRTAVLDGFTIRNGRSDFDTPGFGDGGGIRVRESSPTIRHNRIVDNHACDGLGIASYFGSPLIEANVIARNVRIGCTGGVGGGGIKIGGASTAEIIGNVIAENYVSGGNGGGISLFAAGTPTVRGNTIVRNTVDGLFPCARGGGIYLVNDSDAQITQNVIVGNRAGCGGGVYWGTRGPFLLNNTIADNDAPEGSAVYSDGFQSPATLINNLLIGRTGQSALFCDGSSPENLPRIEFNDVYSPSAPAYDGICADYTGQEGNVSTDPLFVDPASDDYRLRPGSPVIDLGSNSAPALPATDVNGAARVIDGDGSGVATVDIGAHEFDPAASLVAVSPASFDFGRIEVGTSVDRMFTVTNVGANPTAMNVATEGPFSVVSADAFDLAPGESRTVTIRFTPSATGLVERTVRFTDDTAVASRAVRGTGVTLFTLTVTKDGDGDAVVTSEPAGIDCGAACSARFASDSVVSLRATAVPGAVVDHFTGCDAVVDGSCQITPSSDRTVTVTVTTLPLFTLTVAKEGDGDILVTSDPSGIVCGIFCGDSYVSGTIVTLSMLAVGAVGVESITGCDTVSGTTCTVTMSSDRTVTVRSQLLSTLAVSRLGDGAGRVASGPDGIDCGTTCLARFRLADSVTLVAIPASGSKFTGWNVCAGTAWCTVTMATPRFVTATFKRLPDLQLSALTAGLTAQTGRPLTITATVRNLGLVAAPGSRITFFMSATDPTPGTGVAVGFRDMASLGPRATTTFSTPVTVPPDLDAGTYFVSAVVDGVGVVGELLETNNALTAPTLVTVSRFRPDLTIVALSAPAAGQTGRPLLVRTTVRNIGPAPATAFRLAYFMSPDDPTPGAGRAIGFSVLSVLPAGANASIAVSLVVPLDFQAGEYFFSVVADSGAGVLELDEGNNGRTADTPVVVTLQRADLTVLALTARASGETGRLLPVSAVVRNVGPVAAGGFRVSFFMSPGDPTPGAGILVGVRDLPGLAPGANASIPMSLTIPINFDAGDYFVSAVADSRQTVIELDEANNGRTAADRVAVALARSDLIVTALTAPTTGQTGKPLAIAARVRNVGRTATGGFRVAFFMSATDATPGAGTALGFRDVGALAIGANASIAATLIVPIGFDPGDYFVSAMVDSAGSVVELDETNNGLTASNQVTISLLRADLSIVALSPAASAQTGRPMSVAVTLRNAGQISSPPLRVTFFMSADDPAPGAGVSVGFREVAAIAAGLNASVTTTVTVPIGFAPGPYFFSAIADSGHTITELDEGNNGRTASAPVLVTLLRADLTVAAVTAPVVGALGRPLPVTTVLRNIGQVPAPAFRLTIFMSADDPTPGAGVAVGSRDVAGLVPGVNASVVTTVVVPASLELGAYFVSAVVDGDNRVVEVDENNNGRTATAQVTLEAYESQLVVTSVAAPPVGVVGRTIAGAATVRNTGRAPSGTFSVAFYLSADAVLDPAAILLGTRTMPSLASGAVSTAAASLAIPALVPPFDYFLIAKVDGHPEPPVSILPVPVRVAVLPNLAGTHSLGLRLAFTACTDASLDGSDEGVVTLVVASHTGAAFSGTSTFSSTSSGVTSVTTLTFAGTTDTRSDFAGMFTLRTVANGTTVLSSAGPLAGSVFGRALTGTFSGTLNIVTGDLCQLTGTFASR